jgi:hypothetical protein
MRNVQLKRGAHRREQSPTQGINKGAGKMNVQEYALLIAVATPALVLLGINLALYMNGERDTLLLPWTRPFPSTGFQGMPAAAPEATASKTDAQADAQPMRLAA